MKLSTWGPVGVKIIAAGTLTLAVAAGPAHTENIPVTPSASVGERAGWALLESARADGMECSTVPSLTDHVIVRTADTADVVTFDRALELTSAGSTSVVAYCQEAAE